MMNKGKIKIYRSPDGEAQLEVHFKLNTIWLNQRQIADLFGTEVPAINKHIKRTRIRTRSNCFQNGNSSLEGNRKIKRKVETYNLDFIISIGYRVNSNRATQFRIWATQRLKEYLVQGYAINEKRLALKQQEILHMNLNPTH